MINQEIWESGRWIAVTFILSLIGLIVIGALLIRYVTWAKQFWRLGRSYLDPRESGFKPILMFCVLLLMSLIGVRIGVLFSYWHREMYNTLQELNEKAFWYSLWLFAALAFVFIFRSLLNYYLTQYFSINWRIHLNHRILDRWLVSKNYYRMHYIPRQVDNPDQRIQQDILNFIGTSLDLCLGVIASLTSTVAYTLILWSLSDSLTVFGVVIPRAMVFFVYVYILIATLFAFRIGRPLICLNFLNERFNASYRYSLIRVQEYSESIAFYRGEPVERRNLDGHFSDIIKNVWHLVFRNMYFQGFNAIVSQIGIILPFVIQANNFFTKKIMLGGLMQTVQAFGSLQSDISFFRNAYDSYASYKAVLNRLTELLDVIEESETLPYPDYQEGDLKLENVSVYTPVQHLLIKDFNLDLHGADRILLKGPSGAGKTSLLRTIAGLWPYAEGLVVTKAEETLFLSQKPYLPEGRLIDTLYYPYPAGSITDAQQVLQQVQLEHLVCHLEDVRHWSFQLSLGEQQRVALARLLLLKPRVAFLDEATSALDENLEDQMYRLILEALPDTCMISVGHRSSLLKHHEKIIELTGHQGQWRYVDQHDCIEEAKLALCP